MLLLVKGGRTSRPRTLLLVKLTIIFVFRLKVHSKPLDIVCNLFTLARAKTFLTAPLSDHQPISQWEGKMRDHTHTTTLSDKLGGMLGGGAKVRPHPGDAWGRGHGVCTGVVYC